MYMSDLCAENYKILMQRKNKWGRGIVDSF